LGDSGIQRFLCHTYLAQCHLEISRNIKKANQQDSRTTWIEVKAKMIVRCTSCGKWINARSDSQTCKDCIVWLRSK
jgi:DNA-directed RNA polymerase subunit N (RpoN/RPB10)